jgi:hypothetical protein
MPRKMVEVSAPTYEVIEWIMGRLDLRKPRDVVSVALRYMMQQMAAGHDITVKLEVLDGERENPTT